MVQLPVQRITKLGAHIRISGLVFA